MNIIKYKYLPAVLCMVIVASCSIVRPYKSPGVSTDNLFRDVTTTDTTTIANLPYREIFTDTILQNLITEGLSRNLNLQIAYTRIQQAQAYFRQSTLAFLPTLSATAGVGLAKVPKSQSGTNTSSKPQFQLGINSTWEADIWGRLGSSRRANLAALLESEAGARAVQTSLVAGIANYYYLLLSLDKQLTITLQTVDVRRATVETMKALKEGDVVTGAAVVQSEANLYAAEVTIPDLKQSIRETENSLSILLARPPSPIRRDSIDNEQPIAFLQTGVPSQLLHNRPDVQEAEYAFRNAFELTNVAYTNFYPALTISANTGLSGLGLANFFNAGAFLANIAAGLTQPIFNAGLNRAQLRVAQANQQAALLTFQNTLLTAGQEVSDALYLHQTALDKITVRTSELDALQRSVEYSQELLKYGFANYTEVLTAQQSLLAARLSAVNDRLQQLQSVVNLYQALGGGWK